MRGIGLNTPGDSGVRIVPVLIASVLAFAATGVISVVRLVVRDILQAEGESDARDPEQDT
jgi:hypothetical protein